MADIKYSNKEPYDPGASRDMEYLADALVVNGAREDTMLKYLAAHSAGTGLGLAEEDLIRYVVKARFRIKKLQLNVAASIKEWLDYVEGEFSTIDIIRAIDGMTKSNISSIHTTLSRLIDEGIIERAGKKNGVYRKVLNNCQRMDFINANDTGVDIWLPFNLHKMVKIMPNDIIIVAGCPNSGKTGFMLNCIGGNHRQFDVHYFNSEMRAGTLKMRLKNFDYPLTEWNFNAWERSEDFHDVIKRGEGKLNIIDYLELHDNFYEVAGKLAAIHEKLDGGVAIVGLQKPPGRSEGRGGSMSLEKPSLYLAMDNGSMKIVKAKNYADPANNPNGLTINFKVVSGCKFPVTDNWHHE